MKSQFSKKFIGYSFIAAAATIWLGWALLPHHVGTYFKPGDFAEIYSKWQMWIWLYRVHIFGYVISVIAFTALASLLNRSESRVIIFPGVIVISAGLFVSSLGSAFYFHHGVTGAQYMDGKTIVQITAFIDSLKNDTEYITCLVRFGRVFSGVGLLLLGFGLNKWSIFPLPLSGGVMVIGLASIALTMALPDSLHLYMPIFHAQSLWLLITGIFVLKSKTLSLE